MDCRSFRDILDFYLDGELRAETMRKVRDHLDDCSDCRNETIAWCGLMEMLRPRLPAIAAIIRRGLRVPEQIVDFSECGGKSSCSVVVKAQVFGELFQLRLRHIRLPVAEQRIDMPAVAAYC
jgi:hypothetical protein